MGSPNATDTAARFPSFQVWEPWIAAGTTGTPSEMAIIAAPGMALPGTPLFWRVPSTKSPSISFCLTASRMRRSASRSDSPRRIASVPCAAMSCESPGTSNSSLFATKTSRRGHMVPMTGTSMKLKWFTASTPPPSRGTRSLP